MSRHVVITGASEGIGRACAEEFAREGASIALCARRSKPLSNMADRLKVLGAKRVIARSLDVSDKSELAGFAQQVLSEFQRVDVLVNNAGGGGPGRALELDDAACEADWHYAFQVNLMAPLRLVRGFAESICAAKGVVINVSSAWSRSPLVFTPPSYAATKAGLNVLTHELAQDLGPRGVRVVGVAPGPVWTESWDRDAMEDAKSTGRSVDDVRSSTFAEVGASTKLGRPGTPEEIASLITFLASPKASFVTGTTVIADGGYLRSIP